MLSKGGHVLIPAGRGWFPPGALAGCALLLRELTLTGIRNAPEGTRRALLR